MRPASQRYPEGRLTFAAPVRLLCVDSRVSNGDLGANVYLRFVVAAEGRLTFAAPIRLLCVDSGVLDGDLDATVYLRSVVAAEGGPPGRQRLADRLC